MKKNYRPETDPYADVRLKLILRISAVADFCEANGFEFQDLVDQFLSGDFKKEIDLLEEEERNYPDLISIMENTKYSDEPIDFTWED